MADSWDAFPDASPEGSDPWSAFPDAPQGKGAKRASAKPLPMPALPPRVPGAVPVDGDTLRIGDNQRLRVWGIDAPELKQPGYLPNGATVPVGQQSRNALLDIITNQSLIPGAAQGMSYGRTVAPITVNGLDVGQQMIRGGNALAEPRYVSNDPKRQFDYMQAERLARLNRLGPVNDSYVQPPAEYRKNPDYVVPRKTVAQFWDTPTPAAGMRPEAEQEFVRLLNEPSATPDAVAAYAKNQGFVIAPADVVKVRRQAAKSKQRIGMGYAEPPLVLTDNGDGTGGAIARSFAGGVLVGGLDEAGAIVDALGGTSGRENVWNSDRRLADIWANNQNQNASILGYDRFAYPTATTAGEVAGGITGGFAIPFGAGARTVPALAKVGAAFGAGSGFLGTDGGLVDRTGGAAIGAGVGALANPVLGKTVEAAAPLVARGFRAVTGRDAPKAAGVAGEAAEGYGEDQTRNAAQSAAQGNPGTPAIITLGDGTRHEITRYSEAELPARLALGRNASARPINDNNPPPTSMAMGAEPMPSVSSTLAAQPRRLDQPFTDAETQARLAGLGPADVLPIPANEIGSVEELAARDAGRIVPAKAPNERAALTSHSVKNWMGVTVPKVGPIDMVGWVRLRGGINDAGDAISKGGDLKAMGMTNGARKGMDFVGQEHRFGPLINNEGGMNLDDAARAAWEAGYFPEHSERPTVNEFLDALRDTHEGNGGRRFLPDDQHELDTYYGRQAERFDLEQQQHDTGSPVYQDRSVPGDEHAPFAPPEAYQEWPSGAVKRAGNINLDKLESPQDIRRALVQTNNRIGFDAATRGRVTQAETERLADELGMTANQLLSRRKGQALNAEEALAARQILAKSGNELVNLARRVTSQERAGDEELAAFRRAWMRHVAIQEQVSGMTAEAGRALQQFKMAASSRAVRSDVLGALVRGGGGPDNLRSAAESLIEASETAPGVFNALAEKSAKPKWHDKVSELYINFLLSWPQTHAVNIASNTLTAMAQIPEHAVGAMLGGARQALSRTALDRVTATEVGARTFGLLQGAKEGARLFAEAVRTGEASDFAAKVEGSQYKAISGLKGEILRIPTRLLTAEDELFKGIARRMELNAQAVRIARSEGLSGEERKARIAELVSNPTDRMLERALDYGRYLTFQRKLGPAAQDISNFANRHLAMKAFLPFVRTPTNLLKFAVERSPAAPLLREWRADFMAGGSRRDMALARMMVGTGFGAAMYEAAANGLITGSAPSDPKKERVLYADGWQPYSVKIGDTYYSYKRLDPFATTIGVAADMATLPEGMSERQKEDKATLLVASIMGNLASKTWLSGVSDVVSALHEPDRYADNLLQRLVGSLIVPNIVAGTARTLDPTAREVETMGDAMKARIPGLHDNLLPRRDIWGNEIVSEGGVGPDFLSPVQVSTALNDPVNHELLQLDYAPLYPNRKVGGRELSAQEYDRYIALSGKAAHAQLSKLVATSGWHALDAGRKVKAAQKVVREARADARSALFGGGKGDPGDAWQDFEDADQPGANAVPRNKPAITGYPRPDSPAPPLKDGPGYLDWARRNGRLPDVRQAPSNDPWSAFPDAPDAGAQGARAEPLHDAWAAFPNAPQRDVVDELQSAIPGVQFTSGYRTPEYQAELKRRGYHPASNSGHLRGSDIDLLPPPGKSLGWLRAQVSKVEPKARFLIHDGHLHASFPDWWAAPVLGGAKAKGIANPNAGPS